MLGMEAEEALEEMGLADDAPEGSTVEPYDDGQYIGQKYTFERQPLSEASCDELSITREGNNFVVDGELDHSDEELTETPELADAFSMTYAITFRGGGLEHHGVLHGTNVLWRR